MTGTHHHGHDHGHPHGGWGAHVELALAIGAGVCLAVGWALEWTSSTHPYVSLAFYLAAYFCGGFFALGEALGSLLKGRFDIDFLMLLAAAGAAVLGHWWEGALLLFLFSMGHALEHYALGRAKKAIEALGNLTPRTATVRRNAAELEIPVEELEIGDEVLIKPHERIPADGFIADGQSSIDQSPVTGESVPVDKTAVADACAARQAPESLDRSHRVFAGTINGSGALEVIATKRSKDTTLARVVEMVAEAQAQRSPTQHFADQFQRIFVPSVLTLVVLLMFAPLVIEEELPDSFYRAMAVLVAASPCALAISTPSAVLSAVARAGRGGVLVKGGGPLETLGHLKSIAFDKTGTLTIGRPRLTDIEPAQGIEEAELLAVAVSVEKHSDHPLAAAVVRDGEARLNGTPIPDAHDLESITGLGVKARLDGHFVLIGKAALFSDNGDSTLSAEMNEQEERLTNAGRTTMIVRRGERFLGVLGLMDTPREEAKDVITRLRALGIERMIMISGDHQRVAESVAEEVGLDEARGELMPEDKVAAIDQLRTVGDVAMVGDGVNDAPAMAKASVGIAMGAAGSDVALETADVALMADDLNHLPLAVGLSRQTNRIIRQNLWISLGMVAFLVPAAMLNLPIGYAVALHEGSTLVVVLNALRLLAYQDHRR